MPHAIAYLNVVGVVAGFFGGLMTYLFGLPDIKILESGAYAGSEATREIRRYQRFSNSVWPYFASGACCNCLPAVYATNY